MTVISIGTVADRPPGSTTVTVQLYVAGGVPIGGATTTRADSTVAHAGVPELREIVRDSSSPASSDTGNSRCAKRSITAITGCAQGSWLTSIVTWPVVRWRQLLTTAKLMTTLLFSPAGGTYTLPSKVLGPTMSMTEPLAEKSTRLIAIPCW